MTASQTFRATTVVVLEPPFTRGLGGGSPPVGTIEPVMLGPPLIRTRLMGRWHRPRSAVRITLPWEPDGRVCYQLWCGQGVAHQRYITADTVPAGEPLCGTCEGRAVGAGHHQLVDGPGWVQLLFEPLSRYQPPRTCPGSGPGSVGAVDRSARAVACPACGELVGLRASGGPYASRLVIVRHPPGPDLVPPCPFHGWRCFAGGGLCRQRERSRA